MDFPICVFKPRRGMKGRDECKVNFRPNFQNKSFVSFLFT